MDFQNEIIEKIRRNRISSTEVADCLGKTGAVPDVYPLNRGHFKVGKVFWVYAFNESNWEVHEQLRNVPEESIVLVETFGCADRAVFGDLVSKYLFLYRQITGLVVAGKLRDVHRLIKENWPIWYQGATPIGCFNRKPDQPMDSSLVKERREYYRDAVAVCDDTGVVVITKEFLNKEFLEKLDWIEEQEDIWYECIDRRKWDTFETVCLKNYLEEDK